MIGDDYFELRSSIGTELLALGVAVRESGGGVEDMAIVQNLITSLKEPFVFVVVGEVNVGKSTFLNALFGQEFSKTGVMPTTDKILFFRHGEKHEIVPVSQTLDEVRAPADFLRDFHIVDTPGTNSIAEEHQVITERFVPVADLVIFVFSAMNPWGASAWQFLDKVHRDWMRNVVFVLQQADLRSAEEIAVITDYMAELCRGRYGREFPIFPVSGKKACLARSGETLNKDELLEQSGFVKLEAHLSALVQAQPARKRKLAGALHLGSQILSGLRQHSAEKLHLAQRRSALAAELLDERAMQVERTLKKLLPALDATERDYHESVLRVAGLSQDLLATRRAFAKPPAPDEEIERQQSLDRRLLQELHQRTGDRWRQASLILEEDTRQYERYMQTQAQEMLPAPLSEHESTRNTEIEPQGDSELRRRFTTRIDSALRRFVLGLRLDEDIEPGLAQAREPARWLPRMLPIALLATLAAGWLGDWTKGLILLLASLMLMGVLFIWTQMRLAAARNAILDKLEESSATLREMLAVQLKEEVEHGFARFQELLTPVHDEAQQIEQTAAVRAERLHRLSESLSSLSTKVG